MTDEKFHCAECKKELKKNELAAFIADSGGDLVHEDCLMAYIKRKKKNGTR